MGGVRFISRSSFMCARKFSVARNMKGEQINKSHTIVLCHYHCNNGYLHLQNLMSLFTAYQKLEEIQYETPEFDN